MSRDRLLGVVLRNGGVIPWNRGVNPGSGGVVPWVVLANPGSGGGKNTNHPANPRKKGVAGRIRAVLRRVSQRMLRVDGRRSGNGRMRRENGGRNGGDGGLGLGMDGMIRGAAIDSGNHPDL